MTFTENIVFVIFSIQGIFLLLVILLSYLTWRLRININQFKESVEVYDSANEYEEERLEDKILGVISKNDAAGKKIDYNEIADLLYLNLTPFDAWIRTLINFEIVIGLLGTFVGLMFALGNINPSSITDAFTAKDFMDGITSQIEPFLKGFTLAFSTSIAGIGATIVGNLIFQFLQFNRSKNIKDVTFIISKNLLPLTVSEDPETKIYQAVEHFSKKVEKVTEQIDKSINAFQSNIQAILEKTNDIFRDNMDVVLEENKIALKEQHRILNESANYIAGLKTDLIDKISDIFKNSEIQIKSLDILRENAKEEWRRFESYFNDLRKKEDVSIKKLENIHTKESEIVAKFSEILTSLNKTNNDLLSSINLVGEAVNAGISNLTKEFESNLNSATDRFEKISDASVVEFQSRIIKVDDRLSTSIEDINRLIESSGSNVQKYGKAVEENLKLIDERISVSISEMMNQYKFISDQSSEEFKARYLSLNEKLNTSLDKLNILIENSASNVIIYSESVEKNLASIKEGISDSFNSVLEQYQVLAETNTEEFKSQYSQLNKSFSSSLIKINGLIDLSNSNIETYESKIDKSLESIEGRIFNAISSILEQYKNISNESSDNFQDQIAGFNENVNQNLNNLGVIQDRLDKSSIEVADSVKNILTDIKSEVTELSENFNLNLEHLSHLTKEMPKFSTSLESNSKYIGETVNKLDSLLKESTHTIKNNIDEYFVLLKESSNKLESSLSGIGKIINEFSTIKGFGTEVTKDFSENISKVNETIESFKNTSDEIRRNLDGFEEKVLEKLDELFSTVKSQKEIPVNIIGAAVNISKGNFKEDKIKTTTLKESSIIEKGEKKIPEEDVNAEVPELGDKVLEEPATIWDKIKSYF